MSRDFDELFSALARSNFRSRFHLSDRELKYLNEKGLSVVMRHAAELIHPDQPGLFA